jgi:hypothetical protein
MYKGVVWMDELDEDVVLVKIYLKNIYHILDILTSGL